MTRNLEQMGKPGEANYKKFGHALQGELRLSRAPKIAVVDLNTVFHDGAAGEEEINIKVKYVAFNYILYMFTLFCIYNDWF